MSKRYSYRERIKIDYFKCKIKELRYLEYEANKVKEEIDDTLYIIKKNDPVLRISNVKVSECNQISNWNNLIDKKDRLSHKLNILNREISYIDTILNALSPLTRNIAIDLFIRKFSSEKIKDKYYVSNPYQTINDELRYLEVDKF